MEGRSPDLCGSRSRLAEGRQSGTVRRERESLVLGDYTSALWIIGPSGFTSKSTPKNMGRLLYPYKNDTLVNVTVSETPSPASRQNDSDPGLLVRMTTVIYYDCSTIFRGFSRNLYTNISL